jgi:hypothetical protein
MALREQPSQIVLDFLVGLMIYCGFMLILCALPCGCVLGLMLGVDCKTRLWFAGIFSTAIAGAGGAMLGIGMLLHRTCFKQT